MSPRAKRLADHDIAQHAAELLIEHGPEAVTFAQVAKACGLAPPTLVQRFIRKESLVEAAVAVLRARVSSVFGEAARQHPPLRALTAALQRVAAQHAAVVRLGSLTGLASYSLELRKQISFGLAIAVEAGELPRCDVANLARAVQISFTGAVATAALEGTDAATEVAAAIDTQLANYV